ncbi:hypothetical protein Rsub_09471 [Raphidocelis subcapitata]|uniref:Uncharacterized protein n=1 Tax=Raphidocelis subcapitata TaxID=307507 RepID=A0A2V0PB26_9CHLO|nr:hypothetical protein Rsub_09471 [Raphidocelis subcapitata]|eukprot:GBF96729.1 hypothetical protein Rsub_09471 [Raphidocelis subcapitata]
MPAPQLSHGGARAAAAGRAAAAPRRPPHAPAAGAWRAAAAPCAARPARSGWPTPPAGPAGRAASHVCQAHPRRVAKVASQIQREIGEMLIRDDVMARAVCPERGSSGALSAIAGVTHVYVVKAYVSIYSDARGKATAMANLKRLEP